MKHPLKICIIEGPGGSGKSFLIDKMCKDRPDMFRVADMQIHLPRPRNYATHDLANGGFLSALKDYRNMIATVHAWRMESEPIYFVDRMIWSQLVYGSMRLGQSMGQKIKRGLMVGFDVLEAVAMDFLARSHPDFVGHEPEVFPAIRFLSVFNMPEVNVIDHRRSLTNKEYFWKACHERQVYNQIFHWGTGASCEMLWFNEAEMSIQALEANIMMKFLRMGYEN